MISQRRDLFHAPPSKRSDSVAVCDCLFITAVPTVWDGLRENKRHVIQMLKCFTAGRHVKGSCIMICTLLSGNVLSFVSAPAIICFGLFFLWAKDVSCNYLLWLAPKQESVMLHFVTYHFGFRHVVFRIVIFLHEAPVITWGETSVWIVVSHYLKAWGRWGSLWTVEDFWRQSPKKSWEICVS